MRSKPSVSDPTNSGSRQRIGTSNHKIQPEPASRIWFPTISKRTSQGQINKLTSRDTLSKTGNNTRICIEITSNKQGLPNANDLSLNQNSPKQLISQEQLFRVFHRPLITIQYKEMYDTPRGSKKSDPQSLTQLIEL